MKKINELTEREIYALTDEEIDIMIRIRKAEEGIKLITRPKEPLYFKITPPDMTVYSCKLLEQQKISFSDLNDLNNVISCIRKIDYIYRVDYDYNKTSSDVKFASTKLSSYYPNDDLFKVTSESVYSMELYNQVVDLVKQNKQFKEAYDKELKEYQDAIRDSKWVEDEINDIVTGVREKMWKLEGLCRKFRCDYLPIAEGNETIAMGFLDKAYSLTDEQKEYVLANYTNTQL